MSKKELLPNLKNVIVKGLLTFTKGVSIGSENISIFKEFESIKIDESNLKEYIDFFQFKSKTPTTYLYLLAQRAQVACMLDNRFTIAIPGLVHVSNKLEIYKYFDVSLPIEIKAFAFIESKKEGSLKPIFEVQFYQENVQIGECESVYIAKRKSKNKAKTKRQEVENLTSIVSQTIWKIIKQNAREYAQISGDNNPIHTSGLIAKLFGFKSTIIHGWYLVSRAISEFEKKKDEPYSKIDCEFYKAVELPSKVEFVTTQEKGQLITEKGVLFSVKVS